MLKIFFKLIYKFQMSNMMKFFWQFNFVVGFWPYWCILVFSFLKILGWDDSFKIFMFLVVFFFAFFLFNFTLLGKFYLSFKYKILKLLVTKFFFNMKLINYIVFYLILSITFLVWHAFRWNTKFIKILYFLNKVKFQINNGSTPGYSNSWYYLNNLMYYDYIWVGKLSTTSSDLTMPLGSNLLVNLSNYSLWLNLSMEAPEFFNLFGWSFSWGFIFKLNNSSVVEITKFIWNSNYLTITNDLFWDWDLNFIKYNICGFDMPDVWNLTSWMFVDSSDLPLSVAMFAGTLMVNNVTVMMNPSSNFYAPLAKLYGMNIDFFMIFNFLKSFILLYCLLFLMMSWVWNTYVEGYMQLDHNYFIEWSFWFAWLLFIISEIMLFAGFFSGYFYSSTSDLNMFLWNFTWNDYILLYKWSVKVDINLQGINAFNLPLINTLILMASGTMAGWMMAILKLIGRWVYLYFESQFLNNLSFNNLTITFYNNTYIWIKSSKIFNPLEKDYNQLYFNASYHEWLSLYNLNVKQLFESCLTLGFFFMLLQGMEYFWIVVFSIFEGIFPSYFYMITGFHGAHVLIGILFLGFSFQWLNLTTDITQAKANLGGIVLYPSLLSFDMPVWYWNFVDIIWVFVWIFMYQTLIFMVLGFLSFFLSLTNLIFKQVWVMSDFFYGLL